MATQTYTPNQILQMAGDAGFSLPEAAVVVGTAAAESNLGANQGPSSAGAIGVFQFMPSTFAANQDPNCTNIWDITCQLKAFRKITQGKFNSAWYSNWYVNWNSSAVKRFNDAVSAAGVTGISLPNNATAVTSGSIGYTNPAFGSFGGAPTGIISAIPGAIKNAALNSIGAGITGAAKALGPWIIILGGLFLVLYFMLHELSGQSGRKAAA